MTDNNHPITPPPELVQEWLCDDNYPCDSHTNSTISIAADRLRNIATQAARWGADQELEACVDTILAHPELEHPELLVEVLRATRRPKPPSLKEQALKALKNIDDACESEGFSRSDDTDIIRRALESLPE